MKLKTYILLTAILMATSAYSQSRRGRSKTKASIQKVDPKEEKINSLIDGMLPNTQKIFIIDSLVVDSDKVVASIPLSTDYGSMKTYNEFFKTDTRPGEWVYVNGFGDKCFYTEMARDSTYHICMRNKLSGNWGTPQKIDGLGGRFTKMTHPFMMSDGTTMYFAGESEDGIGGYDIYVTTYDVEEGRFLQAENLGLPYNSKSNDILYVEDDTRNLAWIATTRRQPEGKVCIYTVATSSTRNNYDADIMDETELRNLAAIISIKDTWPSADVRKAELTKLKSATKHSLERNNVNSKTFIVDDMTIYTETSQFSTPENQKIYNSILTKEQQRAEMAEELDKMRTQYNGANQNVRKNMQQKILNSEQKLQKLENEINNAIKTLRRNELAIIRK